MNLEVGMYVRTTKGKIDKVDNYDIYFGCYHLSTEPKCYGIVEDDITKASHNIIDLIEVGDYVNGHPVTLICEDKVHPQNKCLRIYGRGYVWQKDIKSVVTKEQFASMEYRVKE